MTRVLVVHHDIDIADQEVDSLRRRGYDVQECSGPTRNICPVLAGRPCDLAEGADVLVYDVFATGAGGDARTLIDNLRELHPDIPVVLTASGMELDWVETAGRHRITPLVGLPTGARLDEAIRQAIASAGTAPAEAQPLPV